jgi:DNA-binding NarL/FixJ family response regulator
MLTVQSKFDSVVTSAPQDFEAEGCELRVLVVDDHPAVRTGVVRLLEEQPDLRVRDSAESAEAGLSIAEREHVDVAVIDYQLGSHSGLWLSRMLKRLDPPPRVVIYSAYCDGPLAAACVVGEADALVSKAEVADALCDAVRGNTHLPLVPPRLVEAMRQRLQAEEQAIFGMLVAGTEKPWIIETLGISAAELDSRMWTMLPKLEGLGTQNSAPKPSSAYSTHAPDGSRTYGAPSLRRRW